MELLWELAAGLPFSKQISVFLPEGRDWWTSTEDFVVRMNVREGILPTATLVQDMADFMTVTMPDANTVEVDISLTGDQTASWEKGGFFDVILSDVDESVLRAKRLGHGRICRTTLTSTPEGV